MHIACPWLLLLVQGAQQAGSTAGDQPDVHGTTGNVKVENPRYHNRIHDAYFEASKQIGLRYNPDFNNWAHSQACPMCPSVGVPRASELTGCLVSAAPASCLAPQCRGPQPAGLLLD